MAVRVFHPIVITLPVCFTLAWIRRTTRDLLFSRNDRACRTLQSAVEAIPPLTVSTNNRIVLAPTLPTFYVLLLNRDNGVPVPLSLHEIGTTMQ